MIVQNSNPEAVEKEYAAYVYENGTGAAKLLRDEEEVKAALKSGFSDCPTKAKAVKAKADAKEAKS